jgi:hypothetical protein
MRKPKPSLGLSGITKSITVYAPFPSYNKHTSSVAVTILSSPLSNSHVNNRQCVLCSAKDPPVILTRLFHILALCLMSSTTSSVGFLQPCGAGTCTSMSSEYATLLCRMARCLVLAYLILSRVDLSHYEYCGCISLNRGSLARVVNPIS